MRRHLVDSYSPAVINRRSFLAKAAGVACATELEGKRIRFQRAAQPVTDAPAVSTSSSTAVDARRWELVDDKVRASWELGTARATEKELRNDSTGQALFLPFPYITPTTADGIFGSMFAWETPDFTSRALMEHGRLDLVRCHIENYLFMVDRFGYMPNANIASISSRSQTPLVADTLWRYFNVTRDREFLYRAYSSLKRNYLEYWSGDHHLTPIGLSTNRDLGDTELPPELASEAETGLDWTPIFGGDVRRCVPLITNCALVRFAGVLGLIASELQRQDEARRFSKLKERRAALIRQYCWEESTGLFREYDYVSGKQLPFISECMYWTLWSGVATKRQARRLVEKLPLLEMTHGLAFTDKAYEQPLPDASYDSRLKEDPHIPPYTAPDLPQEAIGSQGPLQWMYPAGWASSQLIAVEGLDMYGYAIDAKRIAKRFLNLIIEQYERTGRFWEKYNVVDGSLTLPNSRYGTVPYLGWTAAAVVLLGRRLYAGRMLSI